VATEPSEQLLNAVTAQDKADHYPHDEKTDVHETSLSEAVGIVCLPTNVFCDDHMIYRTSCQDIVFPST
jgi:hypothetical protein